MTTELNAADLDRLLAMQEIANLQGRYLYYLQAHAYDKFLGLFAQDDPDISAEIAESGVYVGIDKIRTLFVDILKPLFTAPGSLPLHMLTTPVIEVSADGSTGYGMWQTIGCNAFPSESGLLATWQMGKYDNVFVRVDGQWRFKQFRWLCHFRTPFNRGWVEQPHLSVEPLDLGHFPESMHPSRPGQPFHGYDPSRVADFGPLPPEPFTF